MNKLSTEKRKIWQGHIEGAKGFPGGVAGYCRAHGLQSSGFYNWRKALARTDSPKESSFAPVVIRKELVVEKLDHPKLLPNPRWVAEVMMHLMQGLS